MSKLTKESFERIWKSEGAWGPESMASCWERIQAHTAECVAEAVGDSIKNRYEIGEKVEYWHSIAMEWLPATVRAWDGGNFTEVPSMVRRPPATRQMTEEEILDAIYMKRISERVNGSDVWKLIAADLAKGKTLEAMAKDLGISTEVTE